MHRLLSCLSNIMPIVILDSRPSVTWRLSIRLSEFTKYNLFLRVESYIFYIISTADLFRIQTSRPAPPVFLHFLALLFPPATHSIGLSIHGSGRLFLFTYTPRTLRFTHLLITTADSVRHFPLPQLALTTTGSNKILHFSVSQSTLSPISTPLSIFMLQLALLPTFLLARQTFKFSLMFVPLITFVLIFNLIISSFVLVCCLRSFSPTPVP